MNIPPGILVKKPMNMFNAHSMLMNDVKGKSGCLVNTRMLGKCMTILKAWKSFQTDRAMPFFKRLETELNFSFRARSYTHTQANRLRIVPQAKDAAHLKFT